MSASEEQYSEKRNSARNEESQTLFDKQDKSKHLQLTYFIDDNPPWYLSVFLGFQHYLTMFGGTVALPLLIANSMCAANNVLAKSQLICTIFFMSGIATMLQSTIGVRLPIVQGGTFSFLAPTFAILNLPKWKCPEIPDQHVKENSISCPNSTHDWYLKLTNSSCGEIVCSPNKTTKETFPTNVTATNTSKDTDNDIWKLRIREIQGAIIVASLLQVIIGATGVMGFLMNYVGPLTITPAIALIGLSLFDVAADSASKHWGTSMMTIILVILFSQYLRNVQVPFPGYNRTKGLHKKQAKLFELFPVLLAIGLTWLACVAMTASGHFDRGHPARTDTRSSVLHEAPWFRIPYPGQWGIPTVSAAGVIGMMAGVMAGIIESVGDYYACARLSGAPPVPKHALNRGILVEGICCVLAGAFGSGAGTTSYSENIGAIGITKVGSRRVLQCGGLFMIVLAVFGKFGALFATIPEPIIGGVFIVMFSMVTAVGISNLQFVNMNSVRNLFIIGFSLFFGLVVPKWIHHNKQAINTGSPEFDQVLLVLLETSMWVGGLLGFILDVTLPGTDEERGILKWRDLYQGHEEVSTQVASIHTYDLPFVTSFLQKFSFVRYVPFLPYYEGKDEIDLVNGSDVENNRTGNGFTDPVRGVSDDIETTM